MDSVMVVMEVGYSADYYHDGYSVKVRNLVIPCCLPYEAVVELRAMTGADITFEDKSAKEQFSHDGGAFPATERKDR